MPSVRRSRTLGVGAFPAWQALAAVAELVPGARLTHKQVELMQIDNVPTAESRAFATPARSLATLT
jgi:hypothetical protein